ncbi:hypothetical protein ACFW15_09930, partial [Streptomyces sp. NPDC058953]
VRLVHVTGITPMLSEDAEHATYALIEGAGGPRRRISSADDLRVIGRVIDKVIGGAGATANSGIERGHSGHCPRPVGFRRESRSP